MERLPRTYMSVLMGLADAGGSATLDVHGRLVVGHARHPLSGDAAAWMRLVAHGLVAGEDGLVIMTELGRARAEAYRAGLVREAS